MPVCWFYYPSGFTEAATAKHGNTNVQHKAMQPATTWIPNKTKRAITHHGNLQSHVWLNWLWIAAWVGVIDSFFVGSSFLGSSLTGSSFLGSSLTGSSFLGSSFLG